MTGRNILITGSTGLIGKNLVNSLIQADHFNIAITTRDASKTFELFDNKVKHIPTDNSLFKKSIEDFSPELVIHLAGFSTSNDKPDSIKELIDSNLNFFSLLLDSLKQTKVKYFINTGSFSEYKRNNRQLDPAYFYSATKTASRSILRYYQSIVNFRALTVTPYTVYGKYEKSKKIVELIYNSLYSSDPVEMTAGNQISDFIHINDVVSFYMELIDKVDLLEDNNEYFLGTGKGTSLKDVASIFEELSGKKPNIAWGALDYRPNDVMLAKFSEKNSCKIIKWKSSISLKEGIKMMLSKEPKCSTQ